MSSCKFQVKIRPSSSKNAVKGWENGFLKIQIKAPPEKNKANKELIKFLAQKLKITQKEIQILSGKTSSKKTLQIPLSEKELKTLIP